MLSILPLVSFLLVNKIEDAYSVKWDDLRVTWKQDLNESGGFIQLPRTNEDAVDQGYKFFDNGCSRHSKGKQFLGHRAIREDPTVILLFDVNGYIAGMQNCIPKNEAEKVNAKYFKIQDSEIYQLQKLGTERYNLQNREYEELYCLTVYFILPSRVCKGRTEKEFNDEGTGTALYIQIGRNPLTNNVRVAEDQCEMLGTRWNKGGCVDYLGILYYYNICKNYNCANWFPYSLTYYENEITSFEMLNYGKLNYSDKYYPKTKDNIDTKLPAPVPQCIYEDFYSSGGLSVLNVILTSKYPQITCKGVEKN